MLKIVQWLQILTYMYITDPVELNIDQIEILNILTVNSVMSVVCALFDCSFTTTGEHVLPSPLPQIYLLQVVHVCVQKQLHPLPFFRFGIGILPFLGLGK